MIDTVYVEQLGFWPCDHFWGDLYTMKCEGQIHPKNHIWYTVDEVYVKQMGFWPCDHWKPQGNPPHAADGEWFEYFRV